MDGSKADQDLWALVVAAEQQMARARADFYRNAGSRQDVLAAALRGSTWERGAALAFLRSLPDDVVPLLGQLVDVSMSVKWASAAKRAIAGGNPAAVRPAVRRLVEERLPAADADDWRRLVELLDFLGDREGVRELVAQAATNGDPEIREVGEDFSEGSEGSV
ncbi:hypothetical protein ACFY2K_04805 [Kitasatospora sp. NPDC001309]|uniref:hypothetical protein n=1 Tax=Kitasatospora sp. NPDC001309 TaxID=3364013 RepID=UPI00367539A2